MPFIFAERTISFYFIRMQSKLSIFWPTPNRSRMNICWKHHSNFPSCRTFCYAFRIFHSGHCLENANETELTETIPLNLFENAEWETKQKTKWAEPWRTNGKLEQRKPLHQNLTNAEWDSKILLNKTSWSVCVEVDATYSLLDTIPVCNVNGYRKSKKYSMLIDVIAMAVRVSSLI